MPTKSSTGIDPFRGVRAVLFDLDGTLLDTDDQTVEKLGRILSRLRFKNAGPAARRLIMAIETPANAVMTMLDVVGLEGLVHWVASLCRGKRPDPRSMFRLAPGVDRMLQVLRERFSLAVVTTRSRSTTENCLEIFDLGDLFDVVLTRESTWRIKPHPSPIRKAAELLGLSPGQCLMVGDTTPDIRAARAAGARSCGVLCGFGEKKELEKAGASLIVENTTDLLDLL